MMALLKAPSCRMLRLGMSRALRRHLGIYFSETNNRGDAGHRAILAALTRDS
jgi:hypothetical protein